MDWCRPDDVVVLDAAFYGRDLASANTATSCATTPSPSLDDVMVSNA